MATNFPASLDTLTNPTSSDSLSSPSHSAQHANVNDAVEALQAKVGVDSSAVTSSLDYKVAQLESDVSGLVTGKILQVVEGSTTTPVTIATTTLTSIGLSASITPTDATSKVLVVTMTQVVNSRSITNINRGYRLNRAGSPLITYDASAANPFRNFVAGGATSVTDYNRDVYFYLDSPTTTSATTYDVDANISSTSSSHTSTYQNNNNPSKIYLVEVSA